MTAETPGGGGLTEADEFNPYASKTIAEIIHDYAVTRGDLVEQYARDQLVRLMEGRVAAAAVQARAEVVARVEALADEWASGGQEAGRMGYVNAVRAALAGPDPRGGQDGGGE